MRANVMRLQDLCTDAPTHAESEPERHETDMEKVRAVPRYTDADSHSAHGHGRTALASRTATEHLTPFWYRFVMVSI